MAFKKDTKIKNNFTKITIGLASPEEILENSFGEVTKPETINYRTYKPERDGLFCERIFGPTKDYECACGKYKRIRYKGIVCDRCGVEVTEKKVRRERSGHIELVVPIAHIWYFRSLPNKIGYLLGMPTKKLDAVVYYEKYIVIKPGAFEGRTDKDGLEINGSHRMDLLTEDEYLNILDTQLDPNNQLLPDDDPNKFIAKMGAEAIRDLLTDLDLDSISYELRDRANNDSSQQRKTEALKRLQVVEAFRSSKEVNKPEWMIMKILPVIPPELRPLVPLDGGRFATSDLNDLYRRVIIRNNRLKRLVEIKAPEVILRNEKRMLQEAVDSLFDNSRKASAVKSESNRPLKSLSDSLKGKQGRFRQNLLGKRVDYSARSVIVVGPELKMGECGLPKLMAAELYKPFIIRKLIERGIVKTVKSAKKIVDRREPVIWDILENVMKGHPVLLNRAPTLHRLGIQAFQPKLIEGKAIQLHPLACTAFNADFDGDQMAVHLPLSNEAVLEAQILMLQSHNILNPANGAPITVPSQDMVLGSYYLTTIIDKVYATDEIRNPGVFTSIADWEKAYEANPHDVKIYRSPDEALMAYQTGVLDLHEPILVRTTKTLNGKTYTGSIYTTIGINIFNNPIPQDLGFVDRSIPGNELIPEVGFQVGKKQLSKIIDKSIKKHGTTDTSEVLDAIKSQGYKYSTRAALTVAVCDATIPPNKKEVLAAAEEKVAKVRKKYDRGYISEDDRYQQTIAIWRDATNEVKASLKENFGKLNPIYMMADSGARGSMDQINQLAGMRGNIANTSGQTIEIPIRANYREGLNILEYFQSSRGARKGLADTALRTADSGYLTRRLVDVSQEVIIREEDCGTHEGIDVEAITDGNRVIEELAERLTGRYPCEDVVNPKTGELLASREEMITYKTAEEIVGAGITSLKIRSVINCRAKNGACSRCYGANLSNNAPVAIGEAVGIIAAQSIGEPGTQLTMRTFHTGGIASASDITQGLPRVEELFEARKPKSVAVIAHNGGLVSFDKDNKGVDVVKVDDPQTGDHFEHQIVFGSKVRVHEGDLIEKGTMITEGSADPSEVLLVNGELAVQEYLIREVQMVYRTQGVDINDKHIEVIVRQMMKKVRIEEPGDTDYIRGMMADRAEVLHLNEQIDRENAEDGGSRQKATYTAILQGITKASLATDSFMSAASFQETTRVLTEAAIKGKVDPLQGLKENVIIGKLIPAGTGLVTYTEEEKAEEEADEANLEALMASTNAIVM